MILFRKKKKECNVEKKKKRKEASRIVCQADREAEKWAISQEQSKNYFKEEKVAVTSF